MIITLFPTFGLNFSTFSTLTISKETLYSTSSCTYFFSVFFHKMCLFLLLRSLTLYASVTRLEKSTLGSLSLFHSLRGRFLLLLGWWFFRWKQRRQRVTSMSTHRVPETDWAAGRAHTPNGQRRTKRSHHRRSLTRTLPSYRVQRPKAVPLVQARRCSRAIFYRAPIQPRARKHKCSVQCTSSECMHESASFRDSLACLVWVVSTWQQTERKSILVGFSKDVIHMLCPYVRSSSLSDSAVVLCFHFDLTGKSRHRFHNGTILFVCVVPTWMKRRCCC